jgi:hypothetical protein
MKKQKQYAYSPAIGRMVEVDTLASATQPSARRRRLEKAFVQVPLKQAAAAFKANRAHKAFVWIWLQYLAWEKNSATFSLPNDALEQFGISRDVKYRALKDYERSGLITIGQGRRHSLVVTLCVTDQIQ